MPSTKSIAWGCGIAALVCIAVTTAVVLFFVYAVQDVKEAGVSVDGPADVLVGQVFELKVTVTNERPREVLKLSDIDLAQDYLAGFTVSSVEPKPKSSRLGGSGDGATFTFRAEIPAGTARVFTFKLRAEKAGLYRGDVDVWERGRFLTGLAQTNVKKPQ
jgi:hypothetical protein